MGALGFDDLPNGAVVLVDSAPIIYVLDSYPELGPRFAPLFDADAAGRLRIAIATITITEILTGAFRNGDVVRADRYRAIFNTWRLVGLDIDIAQNAARLRASLGLKTVDAIQVASAVAINAAALVTYDRDFSRVSSLRVIS